MGARVPVQLILRPPLMAAVIKLQMLKETYNKPDPRTFEKKVEIAKKNLKFLYK